MPQLPAIAGPVQDASEAQLAPLRTKANDLRLRISDLSDRQSQLTDPGTRRTAFLDRPALDREIAKVRHELSSAQIQLETTNQQIQSLDLARDMERAFSLQGPATIATTAPFENFPIGPKEIMTISSGVFILLLPLVLVLARRLWVRGGRAQVMDLENSPRLQRIEQAVESIALEVERIGEAQRFTTKLLADRQPDAVQRLVVPPRREAGTITPH